MFFNNNESNKISNDDSKNNSYWFQNSLCHILFVLSRWYWFCADEADGLNHKVIMEVILEAMYNFITMFYYGLKELFCEINSDLCFHVQQLCYHL
jgi:hypothetical protein